MHRRDGARCLYGLVTGLVLSAGALSGAWAGDWEDARDSFDDRLRPHARRLAEIDASEPGDPADRAQRAEKITRDRIARLTALLRRGGSEQEAQLEAVLREWGASGSERRKLRESLAALRQSVARAQASLAQAITAAEAAGAQVAESRIGEALARSEAEVAEAGDRLRARWQREYEARERDRLQRERAASERERGVR